MLPKHVEAAIEARCPGLVASEESSAFERTVIVHDDDGAELSLTGTGYATRCAAAIAAENWPDARWALKVLNQYGHLVRHDADKS